MNTIIAWVLIGVAPVHGGTVYTATKFDTKSQCEQVVVAMNEASKAKWFYDAPNVKCEPITE